MTIDDFARHLGAAPETVSGWEHHHTSTPPPTIATQAALDETLTLADSNTKARFLLILDTPEHHTQACRTSGEGCTARPLRRVIRQGFPTAPARRQMGASAASNRERNCCGVGNRAANHTFVLGSREDDGSERRVAALRAEGPGETASCDKTILFGRRQPAPDEGSEIGNSPRKT
ncbi:hypothetical protein [Micromonospora sp. KC207]|uniref:hypothetical protein n=1 Tax=Micromonospora sp. KC207 TaxID=2530377 RepID=UPI001FB83834|nr:hypothetical protein [Micromonospora sp. KC207]